MNKIGLSIRALRRIDNWWDFFLDYLGFKKGYVKYRIKGKSITTRANTNDKKIITEVALTDKYFPKGLNLSKEAIVVDLGAHIGIFSVLIDRKVYAIEPDKDNFRLLKIQSLKDKKIIPLNFAVSDRKEKIKLYKGRHSARHSIVPRDSKDYDTVEAETLSETFNLCKIDKCDLLKIDVEGAEYKILNSTPKRLFDKIDRIFMELHSIGESKEALLMRLKKMGFIIKRKGKNFIYATKW